MNCKSTLLREIVEKNLGLEFSNPSKLEEFYRNIKHRLIKVAQKKGISLSSLIYSMQLTCFAGENEWSTPNNTLLMIQLQYVQHTSISTELNLIISFAYQVKEAHGIQKNHPSGLTTLLEDLQDQFKTHYQKVENDVFNIVSTHPINTAQADSYLTEQSIIRKLVKRITEATNFLGLPENADKTWRDMYVGLYNLLTSIEEYLIVENLILRKACNHNDSIS